VPKKVREKSKDSKKDEKLQINIDFKRRVHTLENSKKTRPKSKNSKLKVKEFHG